MVRNISFAFLSLFILSACSTDEVATKKLEKARQEGYEEGYEVAKQEGYDEGYEDASTESYESGYTDGFAEGSLAATNDEAVSIPSSSTGTVIDGLSLNSDGLDWKYRTDFEKREFISAIADETNQFLSSTDVRNVVSAIDIYYDTNSNLKTVGEVIEELD